MSVTVTVEAEHTPLAVSVTVTVAVPQPVAVVDGVEELVVVGLDVGLVVVVLAGAPVAMQEQALEYFAIS